MDNQMINGADDVADEEDMVSEEDVTSTIGVEHLLHRDNNEENDATVMRNVNTVSPTCLELIELSCRRFQYSLYFTLFCFQLIPTIYKSVRIYYLGQLPNTWGVDIASQLMWVSLILEIFQEALILPLYHLFGSSLQCELRTRNKFKIGILITFIIHVLLAVLLFLFAWPLLKMMAQKHESLDKTVQYIHLELINIPFSRANDFFIIAMTMLSWRRHLYVILLLRMCFTIVIDTCFISNFRFSLHFGVNGIAYGNIATSLIVFMYCLIVSYRDLNFTPRDVFLKSTYDFSWLNNWYRVGFFSGLDSLIRNIFYILCVLRMMNVVEGQGVYWRGNEFIWNWLLLLYTPMSNVLKQDVGNLSNLINHKQKLFAYFLFMLLISLVWVGSIPGWKLFFIYVMNVNTNEADDIFHLVLTLLPFYFMFMITTLLNSVFYGRGKTSYLAIKSFIPNIFINLTAFLLYLAQIYKPNITTIAMLLGSCMAVGDFITLIFYFYFVKSVNYKI